MIDAAAWRRLGAAALVSGVAHALVVAFGHLELPEREAEKLPLAVRIVAPPPQAAPVPSQPRQKTSPRHASHRSVQVAAAPLLPSPFPSTTESVEAPAEEAVATTSDTPVPEAQEPQVAVSAEPPSQEPVDVAPEPPPLRSLPRKGQITYDLVYGRDRFPVGQTIQTWEVDRGRYRLASRSRTTGIVDLISSQQRSYTSTGAMTAEGLRPDAFKADRSRGRGLEESSARFDWDNATVTLGHATDQRQLKLPPHSQDLLSFMFQLAMAPPAPGRLTQVVTNGSKIDVYELDVRREEAIETPMGRLRALPIRQVPKGNQESIEVWLASEYRYLPVRLRFFNRQGEPQGEQIVADIRLTEN